MKRFCCWTGRSLLTIPVFLCGIIAAPGFPAGPPPTNRAAEGDRYLAEGVEQVAASRLEEARRSLEAALAAFRAAGDRRGEARALKELGALHYASGDPAGAAEHEKLAIPIAREVGDPDLEARLLNNLGLALRVLEGDAGARKAFEESLALARESGNDTVEAIALGNLADIDLAQGKAKAALPRLERAAILVRRLANPGLAARVLATLAQVHDVLGDSREAARLYEEALPHASASGNRLGEAGVLNGLGLELLKAGQAEKAVAAHQKALGIARELREMESEAAALTGLALAYEELGDSARESEAAQRLLEIAVALKNETLQAAAERHLKGSRSREASDDRAAQLRRELAAALENGDRGAGVRISFDLGLLLLGEAKVAAAAEAFHQSLVLAGELRDRTGQAAALRALVRINEQIVDSPELSKYLAHMAPAAGELGLRELEGVLLVQLGMDRITAHDPQGALSPLERGLALTSQLGFGEEARMALETLAFAEHLLGNHAAAAGYAERLLDEARKAKDDLRIGAALHQLAKISSEQGDLARAIGLFEQSFAALAGAAGGAERLPVVFSGLGTARFGVGDYAGALDAFKKMAEAGRKANDRKAEALALQFQAGTVLLQGEAGGRAAAEKLLTDSLLIGRSLGDRDLQSQAWINLGLAAFWDHDYRQAIEHWQKNLELVRSPASPLFAAAERGLEAITLGLLARAHTNLGEPVRALELANTALAVAKSEGGELTQALVLDGRAFVHFRAGRLPEAEADARAAMELFEGARRKLGKAELAKAGALDQQSTLYDLLQQILVHRGQPGEALAAAEHGRARALAEALADQDGQRASLEDLKRTARDFGATLVEYSVLYDPTQFLIPGRLAGLQESLEDELFIWVIRPNGDLSFRAVDLEELRSRRAGETLVQSIRLLVKHLGTGDGAGVESRPLLRDLYDTLIAPVADLLPADPEAPVILIPHGALFLVPFPALVDAAGRHLIQKHTLLTMPSIASLTLLREVRGSQGRTGAGALVVANPTSRAGGRSTLLSAEREAQAIAAQLGTEPFVGQRATEAAVVRALPGARLVHFASHGLLEHGGRGEIPGALALTPSVEGEDGFLTASEIRTLKLNADLVVLSACQSGLGRISSEGVIGLPRSFLAAGAAGVVMSLWRIDDEATSSLMIDFHHQLARSGDPARALRAAMLGMIERGAGPGYWGAFIYLGAPARG